MRTILRPSGENSFLRDALRDLTVVVVGILAALWLESWWQDQQNRKEEQQILAGLLQEFEANRDDLENRLGIWRQHVDAIVETHTYIGGPVNEETIAGFVVAGKKLQGGGFAFDPRMGQLTSVLNSGQLSLISDADLRALMAGWPAMIADLDYDEDMLTAQRIHISRDIIAEYDSPWPDNRFESRVHLLMEDHRFDHALGAMAAMTSTMIDEGEQILGVTKMIISTISSELAANL